MCNKTLQHTQTKIVLNRLSRAIGHMESIKTMVKNDRDCSEILIQLAAVKSAINGIAKVVLKDHIDHCIVNAIKTNDAETIKELQKAIDKFL
ncbi:metal-sensing transcriptional repressor [Helicobacter mesocricetorum]|uniref:metal-sensing transcriptional repressor n=1 Tax=Helicobacter mesocricetorum TaxID=87012 RepID=UPI000CF10A4C|nr:metal-sensing transcriptional repressor [Helicobacter mesocricetorum]